METFSKNQPMLLVAGSAVKTYTRNVKGQLVKNRNGKDSSKDGTVGEYWPKNQLFNCGYEVTKFMGLIQLECLKKNWTII
ncbi:hypothetical protein ACFQ4C_26605 [Larkinella insperata]|uniref:Uncharacterized protein n=1 Tax=Larkinella insperata TaxID=332158 RepID=A0ABW3QAI7_9BACT|nr:hypothetical protein [Larkinella insperata]